MKTDFKEKLKEYKCGIIIKITKRAVLFEFWCDEADDMIHKWIAKSLITSNIVIIPDNKGYFFFRTNHQDFRDLKEKETSWLKLKNWAMRDFFDMGQYDGIDEEEDPDDAILFSLHLPNMN
jgi:hypothetical protein